VSRVERDQAAGEDMTQSKPNRIERYVQKIEQIPTLPIVSKQIMDLLGDEDVSVKKVGELIEKDQAMALKVLKIANSSFYGTLTKVSTIDHALVVLGLAEVKAILLAFSIHNFFYSNNNGYERSRFWKHAIVCSQVARFLARHFRMAMDESVFLSGLIHDMGKVVFDHYFHEEFVRVVEHVNQHNGTFSTAEKEIMGITHYQVAAKLLQQWRFPEKVVTQVFYHHAPWYDKNHAVGSIIVYLANFLTKLAGYPCLLTEQAKAGKDGYLSPKIYDFIVKQGLDIDEQTIDHMLIQVRELLALERENVLSFFDS
jgi:putative nucleotidyltransferase with HDIG domain